MAAEGFSAWRVPASSPDLNPVEKMWARLQRRVRQKDREDLRKSTFQLRIRTILASKTAQDVAVTGWGDPPKISTFHASLANWYGRLEGQGDWGRVVG